MGGPLDLQGKIEFAYTPSGLIVAKEHVEALATAANGAAAATKPLGEGLDQTGQRAGVAKNQIAAMVAQIVRSVGFSSQAGATARVAATAFTVMGDAAQIANLRLAGITLGASLLIPLLLELGSKTETVASGLSELSTTAAQELISLTEYAEKTGDVSEALDLRIRKVRELAFAQQAVKVAENTEQIEKLRTIENELFEAQKKRVRVVENGITIDKEAEATIARLTPRWEAAKRQIDALAAENIELNAAIKAGVVVDQQRAETLSFATNEMERQRRAARELATFLRTEAEARRRQEAMLRGRQEKEEDDRAEMAVKSHEFRRQYEQDKKAEARAAMDAEADKILASAESAQFQRDAYRQTAADGLAAMSALFAGNKALAIASAIADTFVAANRAFAAGGGWPLGAAMMAVTIVQGMANVANIRKADAGFDDPVNDAIALNFGRKFANDVVGLIGTGFNQTMAAQARQGAGTSVYNNGMTINGGLHLGGFFGMNERQLLRTLNRKLITVQRLEGFTAPSRR